MRIDTTNLEDRHAFQVRMCERFGLPVLNVACQEDPAFLGEKFDAINVDMRSTDLHLEGLDYSIYLKNFRQADARNLPFDDRSIQTVVLGEFLEHCTYEYALIVLTECVRVSRSVVVLTFPRDDRKPEEQHEASKLFEPTPGYTTYHRTIWTEEMLSRLFRDVGVTEILRADLDYFFKKPIKGLGIVLKVGA